MNILEYWITEYWIFGARNIGISLLLGFQVELLEYSMYWNTGVIRSGCYPNCSYLYTLCRLTSCHSWPEYINCEVWTNVILSIECQPSLSRYPDIDEACCWVSFKLTMTATRGVPWMFAFMTLLNLVIRPRYSSHWELTSRSLTIIISQTYYYANLDGAMLAKQMMLTFLLVCIVL
jgi:hypothetical protein